MIAGIGCRKGVSAAEIVAAIDAALSRGGADRAGLQALAVLPVKEHEPAIRDAARLLAIPLLVVEGDVATTTISARSLSATGHGSACEAAALLAAGTGGRLVAARTIVGAVTCALAQGRGAP